MGSNIRTIASSHESLKQKLVYFPRESNSMKNPNLDLEVINQKLDDLEASHYGGIDLRYVDLRGTD